MDKDEGNMTDDYIGEFETTISAGAKEAEINGPMLRRNRGHFWLKVGVPQLYNSISSSFIHSFEIDSTPTSDRGFALQYPYQFDGPIRFSRHFSPTLGRLTNLDDARLYSTWKMYIRGIPFFFGDTHQHWNTKHKAAQSIFAGPTSIAVRSGIQAGHRMLYARTARNGYGTLENMTDVIELLHGGVSRPGSESDRINIQKENMRRVKPAIYTYIISSDDDSFRFSETGAAFFVDFASKHALHSNCSETVRYSGEFHPRPKGGWQNFNDDTPDSQVNWELVIDNDSGTYAPDKGLLPKLKELLEFNFPGFCIYAFDREDERLKESVETCREYAMKYRGVGKDELQPTADAGEVTLMNQATSKRPGGLDSSGAWGQNNDSVSRVQDTMSHRKSSSTASYSSAAIAGWSDYTRDPLVSYYSNSTSTTNDISVPNPWTTATGGRNNPPWASDLPPSLCPRGPPRTSSDYGHSANPRPQSSHNGFPIPASLRPQYPRTSSDFGYTNATRPPTAPAFPQPQLPPSLMPGQGYHSSRHSSRHSSIDHSALPPGCAPPVKFDGQQGRSAVLGSGRYRSGSMSGYDPRSNLNRSERY